MSAPSTTRVPDERAGSKAQFEPKSADRPRTSHAAQSTSSSHFELWCQILLRKFSSEYDLHNPLARYTGGTARYISFNLPQSQLKLTFETAGEISEDRLRDIIVSRLPGDYATSRTMAITRQESRRSSGDSKMGAHGASPRAGRHRRLGAVSEAK